MKPRKAGIYLLSPTPLAGEGDLVHLPMIRFTLLPQAIDFSAVDGLIFTSKQGVKALDTITNGSWRTLPSAAIGKQTAQAIQKYGGNLLYVASEAYGEILAKELFERYRDLRWLYPRPKVVVSKITQILRRHQIALQEVVIYRTDCCRYEPSEAPQEGSILLFSSPSIVRCFMQNFPWDPSWRAVAIGQKTAAAFDQSIRPHLAPSPTLAQTVAYARTLLAG